MKKKLRILVLASDPQLYSNKRIMEEGELRGHEMIFVPIRECYMNIAVSNPVVHWRGGAVLKDIDVVIPRIRPSMTFYATAVLRQFEMQNVYPLNDSVSILKSRDKLRALQLLSRKGVDMPVTGFANSTRDTKELIKMVGGAPLVIKLLESTKGIGVVLAETNKAAESVISAFTSLKANILVQEFIKESEGRDLRCFVIGDKVVAAMERRAPKGEFKANLHQGATAYTVKLTPKERAMAIKAMRVLGLKVAGVDILRAKDGPKVIEVNSSPGLEGIEKTTGINIAEAMFNYIETNHSTAHAGDLKT